MRNWRRWRSPTPPIPPHAQAAGRHPQFGRAQRRGAGAAELRPAGAQDLMLLRKRLADATREAHERLHAHEGFAAAAAGEIDARAYADLLARLYGFHAPFEARFAQAPADLAEAIALPGRRRALALAETLAALGLKRTQTPCPSAKSQRGPTASRNGLARSMSPRARRSAAWRSRGRWRGPATSSAQRRFFEAYGERRSAMWRQLIGEAGKPRGRP